jgi:dTDP-4-dehydrorhamnose reductase
MKVLVTGARGMLGTDLCAALNGKFEVTRSDIIGNGLGLDVCDTQAVFDAVTQTRPDVIAHLAAATDVDGCERDPDIAYRVNAYGTWNVAAAAARIGAELIYAGTDFVFDGEKGEPYTEFDAPNPINHYGASKLAGERIVERLVTRHFIVRTAWLYGARGKCFPKRIIAAAGAGKKLRVVDDQFGTPTYARDLAAAIVGLVGSRLYGTYHAANSGTCSWYEFARKTLEIAGMGDVEVTPIPASEWASPTKRPANSSLRCMAFEMQGRPPMRPWQEALVDFVAEMS